MSDHIDTLEKLHTRLTDSCDGYRETRKQFSDEAAFVGFFDRRLAAREQFLPEPHQQLARYGTVVPAAASPAPAPHRARLGAAPPGGAAGRPGRRAARIRSIDVGCMQINRRWHPEAFDSPAQGVDPRVNVD